MRFNRSEGKIKVPSVSPGSSFFIAFAILLAFFICFSNYKQNAKCKKNELVTHFDEVRNKISHNMAMLNEFKRGKPGNSKNITRLFPDFNAVFLKSSEDGKKTFISCSVDKVIIYGKSDNRIDYAYITSRRLFIFDRLRINIYISTSTGRDDIKEIYLWDDV